MCCRPWQHNTVLWTGRLRLPNFLPKSQNESRLDAICQPLSCEPPLAGKLILQPWGRKFLVFCVWIWLKKDFQITIFNGLLFVWQHWQKPRYIPLCPYLLPYTFEKIFCVINLAIYEKFHVIQCSSWKFWKVIRLNINDTAY